MEIIRCLKRFIAREAYRAIISIRTGATPIGEPPAERGRRLRELRVTHGITQQQVSDALGVHFSRIREIERGTRNLPELERRATLWIQTITTPNQPNQRAETLDNV
ncbi:helix-turn-helix transcriptional regulator [Bifidobacterium thermacidophilum]|uniref:helix-turn-helix domain-containing protein n=1 Tax=Bifidobacterium thermacidophilum TaxID=246618 RepID=UPI0026EBC40A|nr:helix-turn-helix transcriptional regulator [Bifidobacterium thermacidophilum]